MLQLEFLVQCSDETDILQLKYDNFIQTFKISGGKLKFEETAFDIKENEIILELDYFTNKMTVNGQIINMQPYK